MTKVWKIAPGKGASHWKMCRERSCILLGWNSLKDYSKFKSKKALIRALGGGPGDGSGAALSIMRFTNEIEPNDIVVANEGRSAVVGVGRILSDYLPPSSPQNPSTSEHLPHARLVKWLIDKRIELEPYTLGMSTVHSLSAERVRVIKHAYQSQHPRLRTLLDEIFDDILSGAAHTAASRKLISSVEQRLANEGAFDPAVGEEDARERIASAIVRRRGQPAFRKQLLKAYQGRCAITQCDVEDVLEAAHIVPYRGAKTNDARNGLLLRADVHTLFDLGLISVNEVSMRILIDPILDGTSYACYKGKRLRLPMNQSLRPSREALEHHRQKSGL